MPIYEYTCKSCSARFEELRRSMSAADDDTQAKCPECGSTKTARSLSVFAVGAEGAAKGGGGDAPMCGRCGGAPGSCGM